MADDDRIAQLAAMGFDVQTAAQAIAQEPEADISRLVATILAASSVGGRFDAAAAAPATLQLGARGGPRLSASPPEVPSPSKQTPITINWDTPLEPPPAPSSAEHPVDEAVRSRFARFTDREKQLEREHQRIVDEATSIAKSKRADDRRAAELVRLEIEADKQRRLACAPPRAPSSKDSVESVAAGATPAAAASGSPTAALKVRLPSGSEFRATFDASARIADVLEAIRKAHPGEHIAVEGAALFRQFPPHKFDDGEMSLADAGLVPNASLVVVRPVVAAEPVAAPIDRTENEEISTSHSGPFSRRRPLSEEEQQEEEEEEEEDDDVDMDASASDSDDTDEDDHGPAVPHRQRTNIAPADQPHNIVDQFGRGIGRPARRVRQWGVGQTLGSTAGPQATELQGVNEPVAQVDAATRRLRADVIAQRAATSAVVAPAPAAIQRPTPVRGKIRSLQMLCIGRLCDLLCDPQLSRKISLRQLHGSTAVAVVQNLRASNRLDRSNLLLLGRGSGGGVPRVSLDGYAGATNELVAAAAECRALLDLSVRSSSYVTDAGVATLARAARLMRLDLSYCTVTNEGVKHLAGLRELREVKLAGTRVTDAGIAVLVEHLHKLETLDISQCPGITSKVLLALAPLPSLQTLIMEQTNLKDLVSFRGGFKELRRLSIRNCLVDGRHFECVAALPTLQELFLDGTGLEVEDLLPLRECGSLHTLTFPSRELDIDALLTFIMGQGSRLSLVSLELSSFPGLTDAGVAAICSSPGGTPASLRTLVLTGSHITDKSLVSISRHLLHLEELHLERTRVSDEGVAALSALNNLWSLSLAETNITGKALQALASLGVVRTLKVLNLSRTALTDDDIPCLASFRSLETLGLDITNVTEAAIAGIKEKLPGLATVRLAKPVPLRARHDNNMDIDV